MQELLSRLIGRRVDIFCVGAASLRGEVVEVDSGVLQLRDEAHNIAYVAVEKIAVVWEVRDNEQRAGFMAVTPAER